MLHSPLAMIIPPHPQLIIGKGKGQQCVQGWALKMHVLPLNTQRSSQGRRLSPSCRQIKTPHRVMTCITSACMHGRRISAEGEDASWDTERRTRPRRCVLVCVCVCVCVETGICSGQEVSCQLIVFSQPCACQYIGPAVSPEPAGLVHEGHRCCEKQKSTAAASRWGRQCCSF